MFYSNVNKIFLGTDGAASSRVGQILPLRVEGSIPYSAPLSVHSLLFLSNISEASIGVVFRCHCSMCDLFVL